MNRYKTGDHTPGGMAQVGGARFLRLARSLCGYHEPTSAELKLARHMSQNDASWNEIHDALGWNCRLVTTRRRLKKFNIFVRTGRNARGRVSKFGGDTGPFGPVNIKPYKPRTFEAAE